MRLRRKGRTGVRGRTSGVPGSRVWAGEPVRYVFMYEQPSKGGKGPRSVYALLRPSDDNGCQACVALVDDQWDSLRLTGVSNTIFNNCNSRLMVQLANHLIEHNRNIFTPYIAKVRV